MIDERLPDGTIFGPYKIQGLIAGGGMGQVYAARHQVYTHMVALKVLHSTLHEDAGWRHRFDWEGLVGLDLKHPHVLSARERVHSGGRIALVLDLIPGGQTLEKVISREFPTGLEPGDAMDLFLKILGGMEYLHGKDPSIVHGDVKPENVMIVPDHRGYRVPRGWTPRVTDFGTVALIANPVEIDGRPAVVATPRYASPEHLYGVDRIEIRSDVYCLGLLFHYILTGRHASNAQTVREAADRVLMPVPVLNLIDKVPEDLITVFKRMVAQDPNERYESVRSLALAIRAIRDKYPRSDAEEYDVGADLMTEQDAAQKETVMPPETGPGSAQSTPRGFQPVRSRTPVPEPPPDPSATPAVPDRSVDSPPDRAVARPVGAAIGRGPAAVLRMLLAWFGLPSRGEPPGARSR